jgi:hypothetical protein
MKDYKNLELVDIPVRALLVIAGLIVLGGLLN